MFRTNYTILSSRNVGVKTLRKHIKIESSTKFKLYHVFTTFLLENRTFYKLSTTFWSRRVFTPRETPSNTNPLKSASITISTGIWPEFNRLVKNTPTLQFPFLPYFSISEGSMLSTNTVL